MIAALAALGFALAAAPAPPRAAPRLPAGQAASPVVLLRVDEAIGAVTAEYVSNGLAAAAHEHAAAVVLELSTPGGLDAAMRTIIERIFASPVPVIGYVAPSGARAASAGFYILLSCDVAAMAPGTNTGAAHPVVLGGEPDAIEAAKIQSDALAFIRTIATRRHRNSTLAEKGVLNSQSFTEEEAQQGGLIDVVAPNLEALLAQLNGRGITRLNGARETLALAGDTVTPYAMSLREQVLDMNADLAFLLLIGGALLLYLEFTHPGAVVPGVLGVISLMLALFALALLPINWAGAGLLLVGFALLALEVKFPTHGALAAGGVAALALGGILLVNSPVPGLRVAPMVAVGVALGFGLVASLLLQLVWRARRARVVTGEQGLVGETGVARSALAPSGTVMVHGEIWQAVAQEPIPPGAPVRVRRVRGLELDVEPARNPP